MILIIKKMTSRFGVILVLTTYLIQLQQISAQEMPGESFTIQSKIMNEERQIQVSLPKGYNTWTNYNVQYMLDPVWNMQKRHDDLTFMQINTMSPRTILVGIVSKDRNSDMTPTKLDGMPTSGNADKFVQFIGKEVMPFIEEKYKTTGFNTFAGHSFGGLCVMYGLLNYPEYFNAYLVGDPSFWYDDGLLVKMADEKLPALKNTGKILFIGGRKGQASKNMQIDAMEESLKKHAPAGFDWKIVNYEDETHNSVIHKLNYDGIKYISQDHRYSLIKFTPNQGEVIPGIPLKVYLRSDIEKMKYTLDGTEPNADSKPFIGEIELSQPGTLKIKVPLNRDKLLPANTGVFIEGEKRVGIKQVNNLLPGLNYEYFEGDWEKLPNFDTLKTLKEGEFTDKFDFASLPKKEQYGLVMEGFVEAKESGYHYFSATSDDGLKIYIHGKLMINLDWRHAAYEEKSTVLYLEKGFHPIKFEYFQHKGKTEINLFAKMPDMEPGRLDFSRLWRKEK